MAIQSSRRSLPIVGALGILSLIVIVVLSSIFGGAHRAAGEGAGMAADSGRDESAEALDRRFEQEREAAGSLGPADVGGAGDPVGEVFSCQGDITTVAANNEADYFVIGHSTACPSNPFTDPSWTTGITHIIWSIDVNGDGDEDFSVHYNNLFELNSWVYHSSGSNFSLTCAATPGWDGSAHFSATFPSACIGAPSSVRVQAYMVWDATPFASTCLCQYDVSPDGFGFSAPIARAQPCAATTAAAGANSVPPGGQAFSPLAPARIYDTRTGVGGTTGLPLGPGQTSTVQVTAVGGVPSSGVSAVVVNVTATGGTAASYLSVTPDGGNSTSSVNFLPGQDVPNLVTVPVSADGNVRVFNAAGCAHVVLDVFGYYGAAAASRFNAVGPTRLLDTRTGNGAPVAPLGQDQSLALQVTGRGGVPAGATAAVLNLTATGASAPTYLSVTPTGGGGTSNVNVLAGRDRPNLVTVPLAGDGTVSVYNSQGAVHVVADVMGWYGATGGLFTPVVPARIFDTRTGAGGVLGPLGPEWTVPAPVTGAAGIPDGADAVFMNLTATASSAATYLSVTPQGGGGTSNLNVLPDQDVANAVAVKVADDGPWVRLYNAAGTVHAILDIVGWFDAPA